MKKLSLFFTCLLISMVLAIAQDKQVIGTVTDESGEPVIGASVIVKGSATIGATTDLNGKFSLTVPASATLLVVKYLGMQEQEVAVAPNVTVILNPSTSELDEVIVVAYGTATKGTYTGSASVMRADKIADRPIMTFQQALNGQVAGLQFAPRSSQAGATTQIRIRGVGSMNASNEPLFVVDGVPVISGDLSVIGDVQHDVLATLNPNDIESITVLKDAAAASLYGSRAANGVIVVTTKKGKEGKAKISFKASYSFTPSFAVPNRLPAGPKEQEEMCYENWYNGAIDEGESHEDAHRIAQAEVDRYFPDPGPRGYFDWEKALLRTGVFQIYDMSVSGGSQGTKYFISTDYTKELGRSSRNDMYKIGGRINLSQEIGKLFEVGVNLNVAKTHKKGFGDGQSYIENDFFMARNLLLPHQWPYDEQGNLIKTRYNTYVYNPLYIREVDKRYSDIFKTTAIEYITVNILDGLKFKTTFSYDGTRVDETWWQSPDYPTTSSGGWIGYYDTNFETLVSSNILSFNKTFAGLHTLSALAGYEVEKNTNLRVEAHGTGLSSDFSTSVATAANNSGTTNQWGSGMISYLSKLDYIYQNKYFLSGSFRRDGSSKLGPDSRWGNFWSASASWRPKAESFLTNVSWLDDLRIRASYGANGTLPPDNYGWRALYGLTSLYDGGTGGVVSNSPDPNLTWESNYISNLALETRLFNRVSLNLDFYTRDTKDLLQSVPLSSMTGFGSMLQNIGEMNNKGCDIEIRADLLKTNDLNWTAYFNASHYVSKVTKLYDGADVGNGSYIYREGFSPNSYFMREWAGVDPSNGKPQFYKNTEIQNPDGSISYDKTITNIRAEAQYIIVGKADPKVYGGLGTSVNWKGLALNLGFTYSFGGTSYDQFALDMMDDGWWNARNLSKIYYEQRWTTPGQNSTFPRRWIDQDSMSGAISRKLHPSDHVRLKNLSLSYNLPKDIIQNVLLSDARIYFSGTNLLTWAKYNDYDPEVRINGLSDWTMPLGRTFTFGIELNF